MSTAARVRPVLCLYVKDADRRILPFDLDNELEIIAEETRSLAGGDNIFVYELWRFGELKPILKTMILLHIDFTLRLAKGGE